LNEQKPVLSSRQLGVESNKCDRRCEAGGNNADVGHPQNRHALTLPRRAASIVAMSIFFIGILALKARFASSPPASELV
jgi:hypothetical protein